MLARIVQRRAGSLAGTRQPSIFFAAPQIYCLQVKVKGGGGLGDNHMTWTFDDCGWLGTCAEEVTAEV